MKISELIKMSKDASKEEELNNIIAQNEPIEDIGTLLVSNNETRKKVTEYLFKNLQVKNYMLAQIYNKVEEITEKINRKDFLSKDEIIVYDKILEYYFSYFIPSFCTEQAETMIKLIKENPQLEIEKIESLDKLEKEFEKDDNTKEDKMFSILLDYEEIIKGRKSTKKLKHSIIENMSRKIEKGTYGKRDTEGKTIISEEEFAFALKVIENPLLVDYDTLEKLRTIMNNENTQIHIGKKEIELITRKPELLANNIGQISLNLQEKVINKIDNYIRNMLQSIEVSSKEINQEEKEIISNYIKNIFKISLDRNYETEGMAELFYQIRGMANPKIRCNLIDISDKKKTVKFFDEEYTKNEMFGTYSNKILTILNKLKSPNKITKEEFEIYDDRLKQLSYAYNLCHENFATIIMELHRNSIELNIRSKTIENIIEIYIHEISKGNDTSNIISIEGLLEIITYYEEQLGKSAKEINENAAISHLIKGAQKGLFPKEQSKYILEKLQERNKDKQKPNMSEYDIKIENAKEMTQEEYEEFIENVCEIRLQQGKMPQKYAEYIVKQSIISTERGKDEIVERAIEDIAEYEIEKVGLDNYTIRIEDQEFLQSRDTIGLHTRGKNSKILLSRDKMKESNSITILEGIFHEITHANQISQIENGKMNKISYSVLKEDIIRNQSQEFYNDNYKYIYAEIDARLKGYLKKAKILKKMGFSEDEIEKFEAGDLKQRIITSKEEKRFGKNKTIDGKSEDINKIFLEVLQNKPELLEEFEVLKFEYENNNGEISRRSLLDILKTYEEQLNQTTDRKEIARISNLFEGILFNETAISKEEMQQEIAQLSEMKSDNEIVNSFKNKLLKKLISQSKKHTSNKNNFTKVFEKLYKLTSAKKRKESSEYLSYLQRNHKQENER